MPAMHYPPCLAPRSHNPAAKLKLLCLHHAGGAASFFNDWPAAMGALVQVVPIQMPGRESRFAEPQATSIHQIVQDISANHPHFTDQPYAIFGHSLGAVVGFELARKLALIDAPQPRFLAVSGHGAPSHPLPCAPMHLLPDDAFIQSMRSQYGGISDQVLRSPELLQFLLPRFRADIRLADTYPYQKGPALHTPIVVLHGVQDRSVALHELAAWQQETHAKLQIHHFEGDHFFVQSQAVQVKKRLNKLLAEQLFEIEA
jgi:medium-chain acyl-[acyl-carrier-protein] hydrolase